MTMPLRRGTHQALEDAANALLKESLKSVTRHRDKSDILTPWKEQERRRREVMVPSGTPDPSVRTGIFHRVINTGSPHLNSREGTVRPNRTDQPVRWSDQGAPVAHADAGLWDAE